MTATVQSAPEIPAPRCAKCGRKHTEREHLYEHEQKRRAVLLCSDCWHRAERQEQEREREE